MILFSNYGKIYNKYIELKSSPNYKNNTLYLFKSGIFFIFIDNDAKIIANLLNLKLSNLTDSVLKCGFPCNSLQKYMNLLKNTPYRIEIISNDTSTKQVLDINQYNYGEKIQCIINEIINLDIDSLSISEAYAYLHNIQEKFQTLYSTYLKHK